MRLDFNLHLQQEQKLVMTQELQLAVKILQLTSTELREYIQEQLIENPMLDQKEKEVTEGSDSIEDRYEYLININKDNEENNYHNDEYSDYVSPLNFIAKETSLWEFLKEQLNVLVLPERYVEIGEYIIDNIDENGYLTVEDNEIADKFQGSVDEAIKIIDIIQSFEPSGIGARNLSECLVLQLKNTNSINPILENIINNMLEDVAEGRISKIAKNNGISNEEAAYYIGMIKKLEPKPGKTFSTETTKFILPDVVIEKIENKYVVTINDEYIPSLRINNIYRKFVNDKNSLEYKFVKERLDSALWLIKSIEQRMNTIKRVVEAIVEHQIDFFDYGHELKPLLLHQIAEATSLHESTVSRAIRGKYAQTPRGLFEIKNFFVRGMQSSSGEEVATLEIKRRIKELIQSEDRKKPLSDQQVSEMLTKEGYVISRRTVAKYRDELGIQSSSKRKSY